MLKISLWNILVYYLYCRWRWWWSIWDRDTDYVISTSSQKIKQRGNTSQVFSYTSSVYDYIFYFRKKLRTSRGVEYDFFFIVMHHYVQCDDYNFPTAMFQFDLVLCGIYPLNDIESITLYFQPLLPPLSAIREVECYVVWFTIPLASTSSQGLWTRPGVMGHLAFLVVLSHLVRSLVRFETSIPYIIGIW